MFLWLSLQLHQPVQVVCLREAEHYLRLRCEELELHAGEQEVVLRELEVAMQRLALDADRRLTEQHRDHQNNIQLLLQKLKGQPGKTKQSKCDLNVVLLTIFVKKLFHKCVCFIYFCLTLCVYRGRFRRSTAGYPRQTAASGERAVFLQKLKPTA